MLAGTDFSQWIVVHLLHLTLVLQFWYNSLVQLIPVNSIQRNEKDSLKKEKVPPYSCLDISKNQNQTHHAFRTKMSKQSIVHHLMYTRISGLHWSCSVDTTSSVDMCFPAKTCLTPYIPVRGQACTLLDPPKVQLFTANRLSLVCCEVGPPSVVLACPADAELDWDSGNLEA